MWSASTFGLPEPSLLARVKAAGCRVMSSATTVEEARWLEAHGADVIIAQGNEAGGHRGMFMATDFIKEIATQPGTLALVTRRSLMQLACRSLLPGGSPTGGPSRQHLRSALRGRRSALLTFSVPRRRHRRCIATR